MESCSNVISIVFILQYVITATQNRVYMEAFAGIPTLDTNAPAKNNYIGHKCDGE